MARPSRNSIPDSARNSARTFFVSSRTSQGKAVLQTERMANLFIDVLRSYMHASKFKVHDFVVMPNHVHVLLTVGAEMSIEKAVQMMKGIFPIARRRNSDTSGKSGKRAFLRCRYLPKTALSSTKTTSMRTR